MVSVPIWFSMQCNNGHNFEMVTETTMTTIVVTKPKQKLILFVVVVFNTVHVETYSNCKRERERGRDLRAIFQLRNSYIGRFDLAHTIYVHVDGTKMAVKAEH